MRILREEMRKGILSNPYEIKEEDIGNLVDGFDFGRVIKGDVGKRIFLRNSIILMENDEQMKRRKHKEGK